MVTDKDSGKPKGYGFCEYHDVQTAQSAVRNLNKYEVNGRMLRVDFADEHTDMRGKRDKRDGGGERAGNGGRGAGMGGRGAWTTPFGSKSAAVGANPEAIMHKSCWSSRYVAYSACRLMYS